jgi:hypothetical protein
LQRSSNRSGCFRIDSRRSIRKSSGGPVVVAWPESVQSFRDRWLSLHIRMTVWLRRPMNKTISASVGLSGANRSQDVRTVQELLNLVAPTWGGPTPKLTVDGFIGPKTNGAIRRFQEVQFKQVFSPDGRVDPGQRSIRRLNHIGGSNARPGQDEFLPGTVHQFCGKVRKCCGHKPPDGPDLAQIVRNASS